MVPGVFARSDVPRADALPFGSLSSADVVHIRFTGEPDSVNGHPPEPPGSRSLTCNGILGAISSVLITMNSSELSQVKAELRHLCRVNRQALSAEQLVFAESQLALQFIEHLWSRKPLRVAVYLSHDNEIGTAQLIDDLFDADCAVYIPKLTVGSDHQMQFCRYFSDSQMADNRYGIAEPLQDDFIAINDLDLILMPLTAFDLMGNRIGMGGGYYDRALANVGDDTYLVGLAYDFQEIERCPVDAYDKKIQMILTPTRGIAFKG